MSAPSVQFTVDEVVRATGAEVLRAPAGLSVFDGVTTDSRKVPKGSLFLGIKGEKFDGSDYAHLASQAGAGAVLVSREKAHGALTSTQGCGVLAVDDTTRALGLLARFHRLRMPAKVVAVTGSNGKTTTKEMIAAALSQVGPTLATEGNLNNEIGAPLTLFALRPEHQFAVIEIGMNHEGEIGRLARIVEPQVGVVTMAAPVHVENLGSLEGVSRAKGELYAGLALDAVAVANTDDQLMAERAKWAGRKTLWFGHAQGADVRLVDILSHDARGLRIKVQVRSIKMRDQVSEHELRLPVVGTHNAMNACAALAAGLALGVPIAPLLQGLSHARPPGRRLRLSPIPGADAMLLDDCYNANPNSTVAAVRTLSDLAPAGHRIAVLGDMLELGPTEESGHREVGAAAAKADVKLLVAFGPLSRFAAEEAQKAGLPATRILHTTDPNEAAARVKTALGKDDLVLVKASRGTRLERVSDLLAPPVHAGEGH